MRTYQIKKNTVVQNPEKVGTALKTLSLRLRAAKKEAAEAGEETDGMADSVTKLQGQLLKLTHGKVDIMLDASTFKNTTQIIREMSEAWSEMTDLERAEALELMAGKNQANVLAAIIQNFDIAEEAIKTSAESAGSALRENEKYLDSIEGKMQQFTNSLQAMWSKLISDDLIKIVVDFGTAALKTVEWLGLVHTALIAITLVKFVPWLLKLTTQVDTFSGALGALFKSLVYVDGTKSTLADFFTLYLANLTKASGGTVKFGNVIKTLGASIGKFFTTTAGQLTIMAAAITAVIVVANVLIETTKEKEEKFLELNNRLQETKTKLDDLTSQLKETSARMDELLEKPSLTFVEQEELDRLKEQSAELERQIKLQENLQKYQQKEVNDQAITNIEDYKDANFKTGKGKGDTQLGWSIGAAAAAALIAAGVLLIPVTGGASLAASAGLSSAATGGLIAGSAVAGGIAGYGTGGYVHEWSNQVSEEMDNMIQNRAELEAKYDKAYQKYLENPGKKNIAEDYAEAEKALSDYDTLWAKHLDKLNQYKNSIDLSVYDPITESGIIEQKRKEINEIDDLLNKHAILVGGQGAKTNAIANIFGENATDELKEVKKALEEAAEAGEEISLEKAFGPGRQADLDAFIARLYEMGIYIHEVEDAFQKAAVAAEELGNTDIYDTSKSSAKTTKDLEGIKAAFDEVNDKGYVTANTLLSLEETMGGLGSAWTNYANTMSSATASTEEMKDATEELVEAYLKQTLPNSPLTDDEAAIYIRDLKNAGVKNAEEVLADQIQEGMYTRIQLSAEFNEDDIKERFETLKQSGKLGDLGINANIEFSELTSDQKSQIGEYVNSEIGKEFENALSQSINFEDAQNIAREYGYEFDAETLQNVIRLLEERNNKEREYQAILAQEEQTKEYEEQIEHINEVIAHIDKLKAKYGDRRWGESETGKWKSAEDYYKIISSEKKYSGIDKEQFIKDYNALVSMYGQIEVELGIDGVTLAKLQERLSELKAKIDPEINPNISPEEKAKVEAEIKRLEGEIDGFTTDVHVDFEVTGLGEVGTIFDQYTSKMQTLASIQAEVANGFTISVAKAREFAAVYPEILANASGAAEGQIALNADVVNAFIEGKHAELNADIDTKISELEADKAVLQARIDSAQAQLDIAKALAEGEAGITQEKLEWQINAENMAAQAFVDMNIDESTAFMLARQAMAGNEEEFNRIVTEVTANMDTNMANATRNAAKNIYDAMNNGSTSVIDFAKNCSKAIAEFAKIGKEGAKPSFPTKTPIGGGSTDSDTIDIKEFTGSFKGSDFTYEKKTIDLDKFISDIKVDLSKYKEDLAIKDGQIALLKSLKNAPPEYFTPSQDSGGGGGGGSGKSDDDKYEDDKYEDDKSEDDKYDDDDDKYNDSSEDLEEQLSEFEKLQKAFERAMNNLNNQQTYIENEIAKLETAEEGVSASYYDELIDIEEAKLALNTSQRDVLKSLLETQQEGTDGWYEVADGIWEVEAAIQESTTRLIEFRKAIAQLYTTASDGITEAFDKTEQLYGDRKSFVENEITLRTTQGELTPMSGLYELLLQEYKSKSNNEQELGAQANLYWQGINNGHFTEDSEEALAILEKIRSIRLDIQNNEIAIAEIIERQKDAYLEYFDKMMSAYNHRNGFLQSQTDYAQSYIDRLGILNINVPDEAYEKMAAIQELSNRGLREQVDFGYEELQNMRSRGISETDEDYIAKYEEVLSLEKQLFDDENKTLEYRMKVIENHIDRFNQVVDRINHDVGQLKNIASLVDDADVATADGAWTAEGLTQLGMLYQQMEYNKQITKEYSDEMKYLKKQLSMGAISEKEYEEQMQSLTDGQWDAINAYKSAEDAIISLNEARVDAIEDGIQKEVEAYQELIDLKKEALSSERDLYDFRKNIQKQTKSIAALERRIASMGGSSDAATIAQRTKLEAQLREAKESLSDSYYDHTMDSQSQAFDDEIRAYEKVTTSYIESLRESIKDVKSLIDTTMTEVMVNADVVLSEINRLSGEYGFKIDASLKQPWDAASEEVSYFKSVVYNSLDGLSNESGIISLFGSEANKVKLSSVFKLGSGAASDFEDAVKIHMGNVEGLVNTYTSVGSERYYGKSLKAPWEDAESAPLHWSEQSQIYMTEYVVNYAEKYYKEQLNELLDYPWNNAGAYASWGSGVQGVLEGVKNKAVEVGQEIAKAFDVETPDYYSGYTEEPSTDKSSGSNNDTSKNADTKTSSSNNTTKSTNTSNTNKTTNSNQTTKVPEVAKTYRGLAVGQIKLSDKTLTAESRTSDKTYPTVEAAKNAAKTTATNALYTQYYKYRKAKNSRVTDSSIQKAWDNNIKKQIVWTQAYVYAKGTLGTKQDQFAITDESWIGDEITLAAGKHGQLQYLKKGSAVMPADISANLVEWGKLDPTMMNFGDMSGGIQVMSNYVSKPELNLSFDSLVHVDHCDEGTLKDLEKMVDTKINQFSKQMNYAIKKFK